jgi:uncharacterized protein YukE
MPSIETDVKGSPGTCRQTATWLVSLAQATHESANSVRSARTESETTWTGQAGDGFRNATSGLDSDTDQLGDHVTTMVNALNDFAAAIDAVADQMTHARSIARVGGLSVVGTVILPPKPPGPVPTVLYPCTASDPAGAQKQVDANSAAGQAHQQAVNTYNTQAGVFNQAKAIVGAARTAEQNAHTTLNNAMADTEQEASSLKTIGVTATQSFLDAIKGSREGAQELLDRADSFKDAADTYQKFATGHLELLSPAEVALLNRLGTESDELAEINESKATQLEKWVNLVPESVRSKIALNPSLLISDSSDYLKYLKPYLKGMPYVGSAIAVLSEGWDVADGEKSPGKAAADAAADIGGSALGGVGGESAGGFLGGMFSGAEIGADGGTIAEPGLGTLAGGLIGGVIGGFLGAQAVQQVVNYAATAGPDPAQAQQNFNHNDYGSPSMIYPG